MIVHDAQRVAQLRAAVRGGQLTPVDVTTLDRLLSVVANECDDKLVAFALGHQVAGGVGGVR